MKILAVDTSSNAASAAIIEDRRIIAETTLNNKKTHSQKLMPIIDALLHNSETPLEDIDLFAAAVGPGSFTGLRIGVAAVKALAHAMNKPCCGVSTLEGLAYNAYGKSGYVVPIMDARRNHVFTAAYDFSSGKIRRIHEERAVSIEELGENCKPFIGAGVMFVGDAVDLHKEYLASVLDGAEFAAENMNINRASSVALAALDMGQTTDYLHLNPIYLRKPQAQREREERLKISKES